MSSGTIIDLILHSDMPYGDSVFMKRLFDITFKYADQGLYECTFFQRIPKFSV